MRSSILCLCLLPVLSWATVASAQDSAAELAIQARSVLRLNCSRCHRGPGSEGGDFDMLNPQDVAQHDLLKPGKPDESAIFRRIIKGEMPPRPAQLFVEDGEAIRAWIAAGAPAFSGEQAARQRVTLEAVLTAVRDQLVKTPKEDRRYLRFFTLQNLYNDSRVLDADMRLYRAALSKAANSLSWKSRIVSPRAIDKAETLFVVDLRELDWDRTKGWNKLLRAYPYALRSDNTRDADLSKLDEEITELAGTILPIVRADWFIATATRPPLYYDILEIPKVAADLEATLKVEIATNFLKPVPERIARAGFARSGVSGQNRLLERHDSAYGYYWKSYDFKADSAQVKLTRFPLGPLNLFPNGRHPYKDQAFIHDGGEIIFSLPNGLQAYMLIDGEDRRIDAGPIEVVGDALKTSGTHAIVNAVSCMHCHKHGMIPFQDTIRQGNAVFGDPEKHVQRLYVPQVKMDQLVDADTQRFMAALEKSIGPWLRQGKDKQRDLKDFTEPVGEMSRLHRLGFVDLQTAACELDIADPRTIVTKVGEQRLKELGLDPLLKSGGVVPRLEWESGRGISLMQELGRELGFTPVR